MEDSKTFYTSLLIRALKAMPDECSMVIGPIFCGDKEENLSVFHTEIKRLRDEGKVIFSQLDYLDDNIPDAPHQYKIKFPIFYKGLICSGKVKKVFVLPGWEESSGTKREIAYAEGEELQIEYL